MFFENVFGVRTTEKYRHIFEGHRIHAETFTAEMKGLSEFLEQGEDEAPRPKVGTEA